GQPVRALYEPGARGNVRLTLVGCTGASQLRTSFCNCQVVNSRLPGFTLRRQPESLNPQRLQHEPDLCPLDSRREFGLDLVPVGLEPRRTDDLVVVRVVSAHQKQLQRRNAHELAGRVRPWTYREASQDRYRRSRSPLLKPRQTSAQPYSGRSQIHPETQIYLQ